MYKVRTPISAEAREILQTVHQSAHACGVAYLVIGATARDIVFEHVFGLRSGRATRDIDFAIAVDGWEQFDQVKCALVQRGKFLADSKAMHRLYFDAAKYGQSYPIDLIPCGDIERQGHQIAWPPDMHVVMSVAGYGDAMRAALQVDVGGELVVPVVSLPGLATLKLVAWGDRRHETSKDAEDLGFILANYADAGNTDRLYGEAFPILEECDYDPARAGARLLGEDARRVLSGPTVDILRNLVGKNLDHLGRAMARRASIDAEPADLLEQFLRGLG